MSEETNDFYHPLDPDFIRRADRPPTHLIEGHQLRMMTDVLVDLAWTQVADGKLQKADLDNYVEKMGKRLGPINLGAYLRPELSDEQIRVHNCSRSILDIHFRSTRTTPPKDA